MTRLLKILVGLLIVLAILWTAGWFAAASWLDSRIAQSLDQLQRQGTNVGCAARSVEGFPLRMSLACESVTVEQPDAPVVRAGAFNGGANLYAPGEFAADLESPLTISLPTADVTARWRTLSVFGDATFDGGFDEARADGSDISIEAGLLDTSAQTLRFQATPTGAPERPTDLRVETDLVDLSLAIAGSDPAQPATLEIAAIVPQAYEAVVRRGLPLDAFIRSGATLLVENLSITPQAGGGMALTGSLTLDKAGLLNGTVKLGLSEPDAFAAWAASLNPALQQPATLLAQFVSTSGQTTRIGERELSAIDINIIAGDVRLGFLSLAQIPPMRF